MHPTASATVGVGLRFLALLIDTIVLVVLLCPLVVLVIVTSRNGEVDSTSGANLLLNCLSIILTIGYFVVLEGKFGATFGKMALGLRVVREDGSALDWTAAVIRNLLRIVDGLFVYLVGAILIWTSPLKQRLGDRLAKTVVVRKDATIAAPAPDSRF
jgi:uncharacterized RDD family membrane protein YckC